MSITADVVTLNFHFGPSLILGNKNRFILTAGVTARSSDELDQNLELNKPYENGLLPEAIPTVSTFPKLGGFFALTYNFSKFKKASE